MTWEFAGLIACLGAIILAIAGILLILGVAS